MMERAVRVYLQDGAVLLCDSEYCWDISSIAGDEAGKKARKLTAGREQESPHDLILCGEMKVEVDEVEFLKHILSHEIESKVEIQRELGKNIVGLECRTLDKASDEDILKEARRRGLI